MPPLNDKESAISAVKKFVAPGVYCLPVTVILVLGKSDITAALVR